MSPAGDRASAHAATHTQRHRRNRQRRPEVAPMTAELVTLLGDRAVGRLRRDGHGRLTFAFASEWRSSPGAYPLSLSMPVAMVEHGHAAVEAYLWGLLPDNELILCVAAHHRHRPVQPRRHSAEDRALLRRQAVGCPIGTSCGSIPASQRRTCRTSRPRSCGAPGRKSFRSPFSSRSSLHSDSVLCNVPRRSEREALRRSSVQAPFRQAGAKGPHRGS
jgi:HipA-like protein